MRKLREQRDHEVEKASTAVEAHLLKIRTERDHKVKRISEQMKKEITIIQTTERQLILKLDAKRKQCEVKNDEKTCRSEWDLKIEKRRIRYEEQN